MFSLALEGLAIFIAPVRNAACRLVGVSGLRGGNQKLPPDINMDAFQRLIDRGLPPSTAILILEGELDESLEVANADARRRAREWCECLTTIPDLSPAWDIAPERFYLALDGEAAGLERAKTWTLISAQIAEVMGALNFISSRVKSPWDDGYRLKSCGIGYRWSVGLGVTPPLLCLIDNEIHIQGGMHRFHLAASTGTEEMPFLIEAKESDVMLALLKTATLM